jgi:replicative DNA helicase
MTETPHTDRRAERAVLGAILFDNHVSDELPEVLSVEHFYSEDSRAIFGAMLALRADGSAIDSVTLSSRLKASGELQRAGGGANIVELTIETPGAVNAKKYAEAVIDCAIRRGLIAAAQASIDEVGSSQGDAIGLVETCASAIAAVGDCYWDIKRKGRGFCSSLDLDALILADLENPPEKPHTISSGFESWDRIGRPTRGQIEVILGQTNAGKTAVALTKAYKMAAQGIPVHYQVLEDSSETLWAKWLSVISGFSRDFPTFRPGEVLALRENRWGDVRREHESWRDTPHPLSELADYSRDEAMDALSIHRAAARELPVSWDDSTGLRPEMMRHKFQRIHRTYGTEVFIVDHFGEVKVAGGHSRYDERSRAISELRDLCQDEGLYLTILAQVGRKDGDPHMYWAKETGEIEQVARRLWAIQRNEIFQADDWRTAYPHPFKLWCLKNKGAIGTVRMMMDPLAGVIWEPREEEKALVSQAGSMGVSYLELSTADVRGSE